jgi:hypothetical protein
MEDGGKCCFAQAQAWELKDENNSDSSYIRIYRPRMEVIITSDLVAFREVMADFPDSRTKRIIALRGHNTEL